MVLAMVQGSLAAPSHSLVGRPPSQRALSMEKLSTVWSKICIDCRRVGCLSQLLGKRRKESSLSLRFQSLGVFRSESLRQALSQRVDASDSGPMLIPRKTSKEMKSELSFIRAAKNGLIH